MITNGKDIPLGSNTGTLPNVSDVLTNYFQNIAYSTIARTIVNSQLVEVRSTGTFMGVVQPMGPEQVQMKPESQRSWVWNTIHAWPDLNLNINDVITIAGVDYKIQGKFNYSKYGYIEYHAQEDYEA